MWAPFFVIGLVLASSIAVLAIMMFICIASWGVIVCISLFHSASGIWDEGLEDGVEVLFIYGVQLSFISDLVQE